MENTKLSMVPLNWKEVYFTNCPMVSANNIDQELGWYKTTSRRSASITRTSEAAVRTTGIRTTSTTSTT